MSKVTELWQSPPEGQPIYSCSFKPTDDSYIAATRGKHILILNSTDGTQSYKLKGHKDAVSSLSWSNDGSMLASGGTDNATIIWDPNEGKGLLKFNHRTPVNAVSFSPITNSLTLASCACDDFGIWSSATTKVSKHKVDSKILDCSWSRDGVLLALAHESGQVSLFDINKNQIIDRAHKDETPVTCIEWIPNLNSDQLVFGCKQRLVFYDVGTTSILKTLELDFLPCSLSYNGQLLIAGSSGCSFELANNHFYKGKWIWSANYSASGDRIVVGTDDGAIMSYSIEHDAYVKIELHMRFHRWKEARQLAEKSGCIEDSIITQREAQCACMIDGLYAAISVFVEHNEYLNAIDFIFTHKLNGWENALIKTVTQSGCQQETADAAAKIFLEAKSQKHLAELYTLCNDYSKLLQLHIDARNFVDANRVLDEHREHIDDVDVLRAHIRVMEGKFNEAFCIYCKAGRLPMARKLMIELSNSAAAMNEFKEASHKLWILAKALNESVGNREEVSDLRKRSEIYYIYQLVFQNFTEPFIPINPETLLNATALLYNNLKFQKLVGISFQTIVNTLRDVAISIGANETAKICSDELKGVKTTNLDVENITDEDDNPDLLSVCYGCGYENGLIGQRVDDSCSNCAHPFFRCFINFDVLPLVEFKLVDEITDGEAIDLITNHDGPNNAKLLFDDCIEQSRQDQILVGRNVLKALDRTEIFVIKEEDIGGPESKRVRFVKNVLPEIGVALCPECNHFFHEEDFEFEALRSGGCPFCRSNVIGRSYGHV